MFCALCSVDNIQGRHLARSSRLPWPDPLRRPPHSIPIEIKDITLSSATGSNLPHPQLICRNSPCCCCITTIIIIMIPFLRSRSRGPIPYLWKRGQKLPSSRSWTFLPPRLSEGGESSFPSSQRFCCRPSF